MPISSVSAFEETFNFDYDNNGNLIQDENLTYNYNSLNQLISIENLESDILSEFFYDESGIRIKKVTENSTTYYFGDFVRVINESGVFDSIYINDNEGLVAEISDEVLFYHPNHLGSIDIITDASGDLVSDFEYLPFGKAINGSDSRYTFTGQEYDSESDLMYYNARYYSTFSRKFTQPDTIIPNIYNPQSLNRYSYVQNNPVNRVDPSGHFALPVFVITGLIGAAVGFFGTLANHYVTHGNFENIDWEEVGANTLAGAVIGALAPIIATVVPTAVTTATITGISFVGPENFFGTMGAAMGTSKQLAFNAIQGKPLGEGLDDSAREGYIVGIVGAAVSSAASSIASAIQVKQNNNFEILHPNENNGLQNSVVKPNAGSNHEGYIMDMYNNGEITVHRYGAHSGSPNHPSNIHIDIGKNHQYKLGVSKIGADNTNLKDLYPLFIP